ncbi:MAG TPA: CRTAC1 family protein [Bryobacteraceae bacterium]|nr:CRTAC1 family protein [Bryobacteraceae bacterium]
MRKWLAAGGAWLGFGFLWLAAGGEVPEPRRTHFTDIAPRSNFAYRTDNNFTGRKYFPQTMCGGVAAFDFDNDGFMDLFFTNGSKLPELEKTDPRFYSCLLRNRGDGTFEDVTAHAGLFGKDLGFSFGVAAGDYDNDGFEDLFICNAGPNTLYHNNGDGTFTDVTGRSGITKPKDVISVAAAWFDYDNDGKLDLIVSNYTVWTPQTDKICAINGREYYCHPKVYGGVAHRLYHNLGGGRFEDVTDSSGFGAELGKGMGIAIADFNGDGYMDVFVSNDTVRNFLFINQKDGKFKESAFEWGVAYDESGNAGSSMGADAKDYDNDGWPDLFYNNLRGQIWGLFRNMDGKFMNYASGASRVSRLSEHNSGWSNGFIDYNNDGWKDVYSSNGEVENMAELKLQHDTMFENVDGKEFRDVSALMGPDFNHTGYQRGSAFADLNNDGFLDIIATSLDEKPRILMNSADNGNHWLLVNTIGRRSNRDGVGASLKLTTASGRTLYNHVTTSDGFMGSSDKRVHFGLGAENGIKSLEIRWPSGIVQTLKKVRADQILNVTEPGR